MAFTIIDYEKLTGNASSVTLGSGGTIPQTYDHLYVVCHIRSNSGYRDYFKLAFNGDSPSGSNYSWSDIQATGSQTTTDSTGQGYMNLQYASAGSATESSVFSHMHIWVANYSDTTNFKQAIIDWSRPNWDTGTGGQQWGIGIYAGQRNTTGAITQVDCGIGNNFVSGSSFTLYGVTGA